MRNKLNRVAAFANLPRQGGTCLEETQKLSLLYGRVKEEGFYSDEHTFTLHS